MVVGGCTTASHTEVEAVLEWFALSLSIVRVKNNTSVALFYRV